MSGEESLVCFACFKQFHQTSSSSSSSDLTGSPLCTKFISFARKYLGVDTSLSHLSQDQDEFDLCHFCSRRVASICQLYDALYALERRLSTRLEELAALMKQSKDGNQKEALGASRTKSVRKLRNEIALKCFEKCELLVMNRECHEKEEQDEDDKAERMELDIKPEVEVLQEDCDDEVNLDDDDEKRMEHPQHSSFGQLNKIENEKEDEQGEDSSSDDNFIASSGDRDSSSSESDCFDKEWSPKKAQTKPKRQLTKRKLTSTPKVTNDGHEPPVDPKMSEPTKRQKVKDLEPVVCEMCGASCVGRKAFNFHMRYHHRGPSWICDVCGKSFRLKTDLRKHEVVHTGEKKFKCHLCPSQYTANRGLKKHLVRTHGKEKGQEKTPGEGVLKINCEYPSCTASFLSDTELRSHIDQIHVKTEQGNSWICKLCGKVFTSKQRLIRHDLVHNEVKNHTCTVCNKDFTYLHNLQKHLKAVHLKERFPCPQPGCDKKYGNSSYLGEHLRKKHGIYSAKYRAKQGEKLENDPSHPGSAE